MYSLNQIAFVKWIHITCLIYCFSQPQAALFWDVSASFKFFLLIIKREPDGAAFVLASKNRLPNQVYSKKTEIKLWIHLHLAKVHRLKELNSPYIVSYLHILILNTILTLPKLSLPLKLQLIWHDLCLACFLPVRFTHMHSSLQNQNQNKCQPSIRCTKVSSFPSC